MFCSRLFVTLAPMIQLNYYIDVVTKICHAEKLTKSSYPWWVNSLRVINYLTPNHPLDFRKEEWTQFRDSRAGYHCGSVYEAHASVTKGSTHGEPFRYYQVFTISKRIIAQHQSRQIWWSHEGSCKAQTRRVPWLLDGIGEEVVFLSLFILWLNKTNGVTFQGRILRPWSL